MGEGYVGGQGGGGPGGKACGSILLRGRKPSWRHDAACTEKQSKVTVMLGMVIGSAEQ